MDGDDKAYVFVFASEGLSIHSRSSPVCLWSSHR